MRIEGGAGAGAGAAVDAADAVDAVKAGEVAASNLHQQQSQEWATRFRSCRK